MLALEGHSVKENEFSLTNAYCKTLAKRYHRGDAEILNAATNWAPEEFLRLFVTAHGMPPAGTWQTHTYARITNSRTGKDHFFLIPIPRFYGVKNLLPQNKNVPLINMQSGRVWIDGQSTPIRAQSIPHTTPFWYFHYNPNTENVPYQSMTLNLSPSCLENCTLCAGAKTGRVNNGMEDTLSPTPIFKRIFDQHPGALSQLDSVAVVTGCFENFNALSHHLRQVKNSVAQFCSPRTFRVLEHNVTNENEFDVVVKELGYDVFITLECFDQNLRNIALNGKVGLKGRDSRLYMDIIRRYSNYLEERPELGKRYVHVTYLLGIDSLQVTEDFFRELAEINRHLSKVKVVPWLSIFTPYTAAMRLIQQSSFGLRFIIDGIELAKKYFNVETLETESGGTADGYARGLF